VGRERVEKNLSAGQLAAASGDKMIGVWEVPTGSGIARLEGHWEALLPRREKRRVGKSEINDLVLKVVAGSGEDLSRHAKVRDQLDLESD
jgi:hypothetical protein